MFCTNISFYIWVWKLNERCDKLVPMISFLMTLFETFCPFPADCMDRIRWSLVWTSTWWVLLCMHNNNNFIISIISIIFLISIYSLWNQKITYECINESKTMFFRNTAENAPLVHLFLLRSLSTTFNGGKW